MRVTELKNTSNENIDIELINGATITLAPKTKLKNMDIREVDSIKGKVEFKEDLTEVNQATGRRPIFG